jgi:rfaE bifunctional protein nucleotidyltransferase chain/domain
MTSPPSHPYSKLLTLSKAQTVRKKLTAAKKTMVFTNGCFDLLHPGHLDYLKRAKDLGDYLMVGLNDDASVTRLKGFPRPITNSESRSLMLSGLFMVDGVVLFEEDTPLNLIECLRPDILVKGGDWKPEDIVGGGETVVRGGKVISLKFSEGYSTTGLLQRILKLYGASQNNNNNNINNNNDDDFRA